MQNHFIALNVTVVNCIPVLTFSSVLIKQVICNYPNEMIHFYTSWHALWPFINITYTSFAIILAVNSIYR